MVSTRRESAAEEVGGVGVGVLRGRGEEVVVVVLVGVEVEERERERVIRVMSAVGGVVRLRLRGEEVLVVICFVDGSAGGADDVGFAVWKY